MYSQICSIFEDRLLHPQLEEAPFCGDRNLHDRANVVTDESSELVADVLSIWNRWKTLPSAIERTWR